MGMVSKESRIMQKYQNPPYLASQFRTGQIITDPWGVFVTYDLNSDQLGRNEKHGAEAGMDCPHALLVALSISEVSGFITC